MKSTDKPSILFSFFTYIKLKDWKIGEQILSIINILGKNIAPQQVDIGEGWQPISPLNYHFLEPIWPNLNNILFRGGSEYKSQLGLLLGEELSRPKPITLWIDESYFSNEKHIQMVLDMSIQLYDLVRPEYGSIHSAQEGSNMATFEHPKYGKTILPINLVKGIPGIFWANFFGPKRVDAIGKEKLLSAPWFTTIDLSDGGYLTLLESSPLNKSINRTRMEELQVFLGLENFYSVLNNDL
jgi:hypothetical protein